MVLLLAGLLAFLVYFFLIENWNNRWEHWQKKRKKSLKSVIWETLYKQSVSYCIRTLCFVLFGHFPFPKVRSQYAGMPFANSGKRSQ